MGWALWMTMTGALAHDLQDDPRVIMTWKAHGIEVVIRESDTHKAQATDQTPAPLLPPVPPATPGAPGVLKLVMPPGYYIPSVELTCKEEGYRARAPVFQGQVMFTEVPDSECIVHFKGGEVMNHQRVARAGNGLILQCEPVHPSRIECRRTPARP